MRQIATDLSTQQFQILLALTDQDRHGYGIILEVADRTRQTVRLGTGALYTALSRLTTAGLVREVARRDADDPRRRYYTLTPTGRQALIAYVSELKTMLGHARMKGVRALLKGRS